MNKALFSSDSVEWGTPQYLFNDLNRIFSFTLDVCASEKNAKVGRFFSKENDGLSHSWFGECCFMNPPYGREIKDWVKKAKEESEKGALVVGVLPARTDTNWYQTYVHNHADVRFLQGRLKFVQTKSENPFETVTNSAPFPTVIAIWWGWSQSNGYFTKGRVNV